MLMFLIFMVPALLYSIADLKPDLKEGNPKAAIVYMALMTCAIVLCVCVLRNVPLKSPSAIVESVVKAIFPPLG